MSAGGIALCNPSPLSTLIALTLLGRILHPSIVSTFSALSLVPTLSKAALPGGLSGPRTRELLVPSHQPMLRPGSQQKCGLGLLGKNMFVESARGQGSFSQGRGIILFFFLFSFAPFFACDIMRD